MPPFVHPSFGESLLHSLGELQPILEPLLGDDVRLDFISVLAAPKDSPGQEWHPDGWSLSKLGEQFSRGKAGSLKVQVLLRDVAPDNAMIHFLSPEASFKFADDTPYRAIDKHYRVVPPALKAGSVIMYMPFAMHAGGENAVDKPKFVLDIMAKAGSSVTGDGTTSCFQSEIPAFSSAFLAQHRAAWARSWTRARRRPSSEL
ncbi:unnamed protein product [Polarella glacialis]|uniref:Phytanoyl-CoA dioxygenase n=2 Tax=Polarella glacialis TaxID=89957 RepID=A0A813G4Y7_POLGL|nr:unnamed protein product [Polarella glacialis]